MLIYVYVYIHAHVFEFRKIKSGAKKILKGKVKENLGKSR